MAEESQINIMRRLIQEMLEEQRAKIRAVEEEGLAELRAPRVVEVAKDVERLSETVEALRRFEVKVLTVAAVLGSFGAIAVGLTAWTLSSVMDLKTSVAVIQGDLKITREELQRVRESTDTMKATVTKLDTIVARLDKLPPPSKP